MNKILVISTHPDDETLGCGGTLLRHKEMGDKIFWLIVSSGNKNQDSYVDEVANNYKFNNWKQLSFLETKLEDYSKSEIINEISNYIIEQKPDIVYLNHYSDVHSDHRVVFESVISCTKSFRYPYIKKVLLYETLSETEFSAPNSKNSFTPNIFHDITPFMSRKIDIMKIYKTEIMEGFLPRSESSLKSLARYRGSRINVEYAEAFELVISIK